MSVTIQEKKDLFSKTYGNQWLKYWNLVHTTRENTRAFVTAVTDSPPSFESQQSQEEWRQKQIGVFKEVFGDSDWEDAWTKIMDSPETKGKFNEMFSVPDPSYDDGSGSAARGPGLPPPPPPVRKESAGAARQRLFTDVFGEGDGLAIEMKIFGDRKKRDLFTKAFSGFLKGNMQRDVLDKQQHWEDDMMQLMTDAMGKDGPAILREIYNDPERARLFRSAFTGYLEQGPTSVATLLQTEEGAGATPTASRASGGRRFVPPPM